MRERDRLRALEVGIAGHDRFNVASRKTNKRGAQLTNRGDNFSQRVAQVEAKIERDLIVARARRVQLAPRFANLGDQPALDRQMYILVGDIEAKASGVNLALDFP